MLKKLLFTGLIILILTTLGYMRKYFSAKT